MAAARPPHGHAARVLLERAAEIDLNARDTPQLRAQIPKSDHE
jgi:hypothetical protein